MEENASESASTASDEDECSTEVEREPESNSCRDIVLHSNVQTHLSWEADRTWCIRLLELAAKSVKMQMLMAWYSTLGGAHSALGSYSLQHAEQAGNVSQRQLLLATELRDPMLVSKCKMYMAFSLLQRGKTKRAARIVREQYRFAVRESSIQDSKLISMCVSAWQQIKSLREAGGAVGLEEQSNIQLVNE